MEVRSFAAPAFQMVTIGLALFLPAGTLRWTEGWVYLALTFIIVVAVPLILKRHDPGLAAERFRSVVQKDQTQADKAIVTAVAVLNYVLLIVSAADARRFGDGSAMPIWLQTIGALALLGASGVFYRVARENSFAIPVVRVQKERGHRVVSTGPYRYVRHPMYVGSILWFVGTPLLLGSWLGLAVAGILVVQVAIRIVLEERTLREQLDGYRDYTQRVRYRLIPGVW